MKKNILFLSLITLLSSSCGLFHNNKMPQKLSDGAAKQNQAYQYSVDLTKADNDILHIELVSPRLQKTTLNFVIPKIVPGIYGAMNFGQYVKNFQAKDSKNNLLESIKIDENTWQIKGAEDLTRITYDVDDTWDKLVENRGGPIFYNSAGSNYEPKKLFTLNYNTICGYFEGFEKMPYEVVFTKPKNFYGASYLTPTPISDNKERVNAQNYNELVDSPIIYSEPDTAWFQVANCKVLVALNSDTFTNKAKEIAHFLEKILTYQKDYLGGKLPVDKYVFLVQHTKVTNPENTYSEGLEHAHSTLCLYQTFDMATLNQKLEEIASHEFFHVLTPLNVHSEEIQNYNFRNPKFSKHLWLYEGLTEYATMHAPLKQKYSNMDAFLKEINLKMRISKSFDPNLSLAEMSTRAMDKQDQYYNIYLKGALINLCLDIELRQLSGGKMGTQDLLQKLMERYGADKPFKDEELFDTIASLTYPSIKDFLVKYVDGTEPLPFKEQFAKVGFETNPDFTKVNIATNPTTEQLALRKAWIGE
jgi:predicted metalloprotease with PDZ domain